MAGRREQWADVAKGLGILLVLIGHWYYGCLPLRTIIYSFHMPLFFMLSGLGLGRFHHHALSNFVARQITRFVIPFLVFWIIAVVVSISFNGVHRWLFGGLIIGRPVVNGPLWFLVTLCCVQICFFCYVKLSRWPLLLMAIVVPACLVANHLPVLPLMMVGWPFGILFMMVGYAFFQFLNSIKFSRIIIVCIGSCFAFLSYMIVFRPETTYMAINMYPAPMSFIVTGVTGSSVVICVSKLLTFNFPLCSTVLGFIGSKSLYYFGADRILYIVWCNFFLIDDALSRFLFFILHVAALTILTFPLSLIIGWCGELVRRIQEGSSSRDAPSVCVDNEA